VKTFFDATVWCSAILRPEGINARLLDLASLGGPLRGVTSDVVLLEFFRHAVDGTFGIVFDPEDVRDYLEAHRPLIDVQQAPIGRSLPSRTDLHNLPLNQIVYELTGKTRVDLLASLGRGTTLSEFDPYDLHVLAAAAEAGAEAICSSDGIFEKVDWIKVFTPGRLGREFGL
jgi:predicted nucleic acid-binding protein